VKQPAYRTWCYICLGCGWKAPGWEARVPADQDEVKCGPVECGKCSGIRFQPELVEAKRCA
jgi:hypothetical protein